MLRLVVEKYPPFGSTVSLCSTHAQQAKRHITQTHMQWLVFKLNQIRSCLDHHPSETRHIRAHIHFVFANIEKSLICDKFSVRDTICKTIYVTILSSPWKLRENTEKGRWLALALSVLVKRQVCPSPSRSTYTAPCHAPPVGSHQHLVAVCPWPCHSLTQTARTTLAVPPTQSQHSSALPLWWPVIWGPGSWHHLQLIIYSLSQLCWLVKMKRSAAR